VVLGFGISTFLQFGALVFTTASDVALLISSESLFTAAFSRIFLKERITRRTIFALLLGFFGVYLVIEQGLLRFHTGIDSQTLVFTNVEQRVALKMTERG